MKSFMKIQLILIALIVGFCCGMSSNAQTPQVQEYELWKLQNDVIQYAFKSLHKGAWVERKIVYKNGYDIEKDVYVGYLRDALKHKRFYVVEISMTGSVNQIWCSFVTKKVFHKGKLYKFETIKPIKAYIYKNGRTYYVSEFLIDDFMKRRGPWSTILYQGTIVNPPNEKNGVEISNVQNSTIASHRVVRAKKIKSLKNGSEILVSIHVPFGFVQSGNSYLYDFAFRGGIRRITDNIIKHAIPISGMIPHGIPINNRYPVPPINPFK